MHCFKSIVSLNDLLVGFGDIGKKKSIIINCNILPITINMRINPLESPGLGPSESHD